MSTGCITQILPEKNRFRAHLNTLGRSCAAVVRFQVPLEVVNVFHLPTEHIVVFFPRSDGIPVIFLSQPLRRYTDSGQMSPELLALGQKTFRFLESLPFRVVGISLFEQTLSSFPLMFLTSLLLTVIDIGVRHFSLF